MRLPVMILAILGLSASVAAQTQDSAVAEGLALLGSACKLSLAQTQHHQIKAAHKVNVQGARFQLELDFQLGSGTSATVGKLQFNCHSERGTVGVLSDVPPHLTMDGTAFTSVSAARVLKDEDSGGRYFRHVKWERRIEAANWQGAVAYSDFTFGDGQKTRTSFYLVCEAKLQIPCFELTLQPGQKNEELRHRRILAFVREISLSL
jgi:hypothetical protein